MLYTIQAQCRSEQPSESTKSTDPPSLTHSLSPSKSPLCTFAMTDMARNVAERQSQLIQPLVQKLNRIHMKLSARSCISLKEAQKLLKLYEEALEQDQQQASLIASALEQLSHEKKRRKSSDSERGDFKRSRMG